MQQDDENVFEFIEENNEDTKNRNQDKVDCLDLEDEGGKGGEGETQTVIKEFITNSNENVKEKHDADAEYKKELEFNNNENNNNHDVVFEFNQVQEEPKIEEDPQQDNDNKKIDAKEDDFDFNTVQEEVVIEEIAINDNIKKTPEVKEEEFDFSAAEEESKHENDQITPEGKVEEEPKHNNDKKTDAKEDEFACNEVEEEPKVINEEIKNNDILEQNDIIDNTAKPDVKEDEFEFNDVEEITNEIPNRAEDKTVQLNPDFIPEETNTNQRIENIPNNTNNIIIDNKSNNEEDEFNFVEENTEEKTHNNPNPIIENKVSSEEDEFNFVEDENPKAKENMPISEKVEIKIEVPKVVEDDEDEFNFVDEDENTNTNAGSTQINTNLEQATTINFKQEEKPKADNNDEFEFVEESEEVVETTNNNYNENRNAKTTLPTQTEKINNSLFIEGKNSSNINSLIQSYRNKYITIPNKVESEDSQTNLPSTDRISDFYLDIEKRNLELSKLIESIPHFKSEPEIGIRSLHIDEVNKNLESNKRLLTKKENMFDLLYKDISNESIKKLYFKFINLKNNYINSAQVTATSASNKNIPTVIKISSSNEMADTDNNIFSPEARKDTKDALEFSEDDKKKKGTSSSIGKIKQNSGDFDFEDEIHDENEDNENEEFETDKTKTKNVIEIDKALYEIVVDNNYTPTVPKMEEKSEVETETPVASVFDANTMMEMLKNINKNKDSANKNGNVNVNQKSEEEIHNEEFLKIVNTLPNYNFMVSKYVEYPDSFFNI